MKGILEMIGRADVWELYLAAGVMCKKSDNPGATKQKKSIYRDKYVPINVVVHLEAAIKMNHRQLWFIGELQRGRRLKSEDIAKQWWVTDKTAKRDLASLIQLKMVQFTGARKNGWYALIC